MEIPVTVTFYTTLIVNDEDVINRVDDEWRGHLYDLHDDEIAEHLARNMVLGASLSQLEGWGDMDDSAATLRINDQDAYVSVCF